MGNDPSAMLIAVGAILLLALSTRWIFRPARRRPVTMPIDASDSPNLGLLTVVATGLTRTDALRQRAVLGDAQIRSSMSRRRDGRLDVLVFHSDVDRARALLDIANP